MNTFIRKNIRLKGFEYEKGYAYFITICSYKNQNFFFGKLAQIIQTELKLRHDKNEINLICYCIMPNHVHLLLSLKEYNKSLGNWVSAFKRFTAKLAKEKFNISKLWQVNFYDHIIRKDEALNNTSEYILNNPVRKNLSSKWEDYQFCGILQ